MSARGVGLARLRSPASSCLFGIPFRSRWPQCLVRFWRRTSRGPGGGPAVRVYRLGVSASSVRRRPVDTQRHGSFRRPPRGPAEVPRRTHGMRRGRLLTALVVLALSAASATTAFGQGGATSTIAGTVVDSSGAVVPGADIVAKNIATGTTFQAVSGADGGFVIPAVPHRHLRDHRHARGLQDGGPEGRGCQRRADGQRESGAHPGRPRGDRHGDGCRRDRADAGHVGGHHALESADRQACRSSAVAPSNWWASCPACRRRRVASGTER